MKKVLMLLAAVSLAVGMASFATAEESYTLKGKVVSIDSAGKSVVIFTSEGEKTLTIQGSAKGMKPGMNVEVTCIDVEGKTCMKDFKVVHVSETAKGKMVEGEVVSIDSEGKAIVIKTSKGKQKTIPVIGKPVVEKVTVSKEAPAGEQLKVETTTLKEIKPGEKVMLDCFDSEGKFCVSKVMVVPAEPLKMMEVTGKVVSIDSEGKAVVVQTKSGKKTLYYQKTTGGASMSDLEVGKKVKAYCIDVGGKACIKDISVTK